MVRPSPRGRSAIKRCQAGAGAFPLLLTLLAAWAPPAAAVPLAADSGIEIARPAYPVPVNAIASCPTSSSTSCSPAPPEDDGEIPDAGAPNRQRWSFDDNKFCIAGPGSDCNGSNPGTNFCNNPEPFEMYILADCGTEMHLPFNDVESGCISIFHDAFPAAPQPVTIYANNGLPPSHPNYFNVAGNLVCWSAQDCSGTNPALCNRNVPGGGETPPNCPGGPGDQVTIDVSFRASPAICGVYIARFSYWGGCRWDLFSNCDGSNADHFRIYKSICDARAAYNPLPQLVLQNLITSDGGGCSVEYCVDVLNVGCILTPSFVVRVGNGVGSTDHVIPAGFPSGGFQTLCGAFLVPQTGSPVTTTVTATADANNAILECNEVPGATSCFPGTGSHAIQRDQLIDPPTARVLPAGPICPGNPVTLDASASTVSNCTAIEYQWRDASGILQPWSAASTLVVSPVTTNTYVVEVRCPTRTWCSDSETVTVAVTTGPVARILPVGPVCPGASATLDASTSTAPACTAPREYQWRDGTGVIQPWSSLPTLVVTPATTTTYTLEVRCPTNPTCIGSTQATVVVSPAPVAATTTPAPVCAGTQVTIDASSSTAPGCAAPLEYQWRDASGVVQAWSASPLLVLTPAATSTYTAEVRCSTSPSCTGSTTVTAEVEPYPTATATVPSPICVGTAVSVDASSSSANGCTLPLEFQLRDGATVLVPWTPSPSLGSFTPALSTTLTVEVRCPAAQPSCSAILSLPLDVVLPHAVAGPDPTVCQNAALTLDGAASSVPGCSGGRLYEWRKGAVVVQSASPVSGYNPSTTAVGVVTYTLVVSCATLPSCQASDDVTVTVRTCAMAVRFDSFAARAFPGTGFEVTWRTLSEEDTTAFVVERAATEGGPYAAVGSPVAALGPGFDYRLTDAGSVTSSLPWYRVVEYTSSGRGDQTPAFRATSAVPRGGPVNGGGTRGRRGRAGAGTTR